MTEPLTPERLQEIRERCETTLTVPLAALSDLKDLLDDNRLLRAEIERLKALLEKA